MLQYFTEQLENCEPLSEESALQMVARRVENGGDEATLTEKFKSKIGQRLLYFMKSGPDRLEILSTYENDVETDLKGATFIEMTGGGSSGGAIPKFSFPA